MPGFLAGEWGRSTDRDLSWLRTGEHADGVELWSDAGLTLACSRPVRSRDGIVAAFDGYLSGVEGSPADRLIDIYLERGADGFQHLHGNHRFALFARDRQRLYLARDHIGNRQVFYSTGDAFRFASSFIPLLRHDDISNTLNEDILVDYIRCGWVAGGGPDTLLRDVEKLRPSQFLTRSNGRIRKRIYWQPPAPNRDISDRAAADLLEEQMVEAAEQAVDSCTSTPTIFLSGGLDSSLLALLLRQTADEVNAITFGHGADDEHLEKGRTRAEELGFDHENVVLSPSLPSRGDAWRLERPQLFLYYYHMPYIVDRTGIENFFDGSGSVIPFPTGLRKVRRLRYLRHLKPVCRAVKATGVDGRLSPDGDIGKGIDSVASPHPSTAITTSYTVRPAAAREFTSIPEQTALEERIESAWELSGHPVRDFDLLQVRVRYPRIISSLGKEAEHHDVFGDPRVISVARSLPVQQRSERRLLRMIARDDIDVERLHRQESAPSYECRFMNTKLERNWADYRDAIHRFSERGYLSSRGETYLLPDEAGDFSVGRAWFMGNIYLLEKWLETFIDRQEYWTPPPEPPAMTGP